MVLQISVSLCSLVQVTYIIIDVKLPLVVRVTYQPTDFSVLVRAYGKGSELIIDRKQEVVVK
jgi:hypothetical protein